MNIVINENENMRMPAWRLRFEFQENAFYISCTPTGRPLFQKAYSLQGWDVEEDDGFKIYFHQTGPITERIVLDLDVNDNVPQTGIRFETWLHVAEGVDRDIMSFQMSGTADEIAAIRDGLDILHDGGNLPEVAEYTLTEAMNGGRRRTRRRRARRVKRRFSRR